MKNIIKLSIPALLTVMAVSCSGWLEPQSKDITGFGNGNNPSTPKAKEYYEALRAYKQSDHAVSFGWFGNWTGVGASLENCMAGLPDSVDIISSWGGWRNLSKAQQEDLKFVQEVKGTKVLAVFIVQDMGSGGLVPAQQNKTAEDRRKYWGWDDSKPETIEAAVVKYANTICDTIEKYGFDGFDIDYEPNYGHRGELGGNDTRMMTFIKTMGDRLHKKGKILVVDGEPQSLPKEAGKYLDYFIVQAYACHGDYDLDGRLQATINNYNGVLTPEEVAARYIVTENFESYAKDGGVSYTANDGKEYSSLEGMARWNPTINGKQVRKGGIGTYHMEYEYRVDGKPGTYPYLRKAMQLINPPIKY